MWKHLLLVLFANSGISGDLNACTTGECYSSMNILELAASLGATEFLNLVNVTGIATNLTTHGPLTVLIPSNEAFRSLPDEQKQNLQDTSYAKSLLMYHIIHGRHMKDSFQNEATYKSKSTMEGSDTPLIVRINFYKNKEITTASGSPIQSFDHIATNGVIHILSRVMYMTPVFGTVAQVTSLPITTYMAYGLVDGGLVQLLNRKYPHTGYTLFAPTDLAFEALPNKTMNILRGNKTAIRRVMENHIISGTYFTAGMYEDETLTTMLGENLTVSSIKGNVTVSGSYLALPDFTATNGVVHFATKVFFPSDWDFS